MRPPEPIAPPETFAPPEGPVLPPAGVTAAAAAMVVCGLSIAALTGAIMKILAEDLPPLQVSWSRFAVFALLLLPVVALRNGRAALRPARPWVQVVRGVAMAGSNVAFVVGIREMEMGDGMAVLYAYPFMMTVMAALFLGERVGRAGWLGVFGGFAGVVLVVRPEVGRIDLPALMILLCAFLVAVQMILNRKLGAISDPLVISFWGAGLAALALAPFLPMVWESFTLRQFWLMVLSGALGAVSQTLVVMAFTRAPAGALAPLTYCEIVAGVAIGALIFGTLPDAVAWAGIGLIIASGLMLVGLRGPRQVPRRFPKI